LKNLIKRCDKMLVVELENRDLIEIRCPHCSHEYEDSDDIKPLGNCDFAEIICENCKKHFWWSREVTIEYTTGTEEPE